MVCGCGVWMWCVDVVCGCGVWMWCVDVVSVESGQKVLLIGYKSTDHH